MIGKFWNIIRFVLTSLITLIRIDFMQNHEKGFLIDHILYCNRGEVVASTQYRRAMARLYKPAPKLQNPIPIPKFSIFNSKLTNRTVSSHLFQF